MSPNLGPVGKKPPLVGILGGMGPEATIELMGRVLRGTEASGDQDHIPLLVYNNPQVPSRVEAFMGTGPSPVPTLVSMARSLIAAGATLLAMPCNTAHLALEEIRSQLPVPILDMTGLVAARVVGAKRVGVLGTLATMRLRLYDRSLTGIDVVYPSPHGQRATAAVIDEVKARGSWVVDPGPLDAAMADLVASGAERLVLGCTELSLLASRLACPVPVVDPLQLLADEIVRLSGKHPSAA